MRLYRWLMVPLALAILFSVAPTQAQTRREKNNVVTIEPVYDEEDIQTLLDEDEIAKIDRLQNDIVYPSLESPVSPDDEVIFLSTGEQLGFLNINDGSTSEFPLEALGPYLPLPLLGISSFTWLDDTTLGMLALDFSAENAEDAVVLLGVNRNTYELSSQIIALPLDAGIVSISPDLLHFLLVVVPEEESGDATDIVSFPINQPVPSVTLSERIKLPTAYQSRVDQAYKSFGPLLNRFRLMQEDATDGNLEMTANTLDLVTLNAATGESHYVTTIPEVSGVLGEAWTKDSSRLAFSTYSLTDPEELRPAFDGALISEVLYRDVTGNLAPVDNPLLQTNNTYVVNTVSHEVDILRPEAGAAPPLLAADGWSPDNQTLLVKAWHPARIKGRTYPTYTLQFSERSSYRFYDSELKLANKLELDSFAGAGFSEATALFVSPDELIFRAAVGSNRQPYYYNRVSGELSNIGDMPGVYGGIRSTNNSRQIVFIYHSFTSPYDIYKSGWNGRSLARLTWFNEELREFANLRQDPVRFTLRNGQVRVGTLIQSADAEFPPKNQPLIVWQEGGPGVAMYNQWLSNVENPYALLPNFGFSLLVVPLSGRPGYTPATFNALADNSNYGQIDIDEQAEIVQQAITRGWTSRGKIGITGCSYGGYFTWQSIIRYPDLYTAANPQCALVDLITEWTRGYDVLLPHLEGLPPYNNPAEYRNDSPSYNVSKVKAAVLSFHGTDDFLPIVQNENMHLQLYNRGVPARMIRFVGEGHGLSDPYNQLYAAQEQINWFRTHLR